MPTSLAEIINEGRLRVAINKGNKALVSVKDGLLEGVSPALARRLASDLDARFHPVVYEGAGQVFDDCGRDIWDVAFLAIDSKRSEKITFTRPYVVIGATYAVRRDSDRTTVASLDTPGRTVVLSKGSAYDMYLSNHLRHAQIERLSTPEESFQAFMEGRGDAVAGVRETLEAAFADDPAYRVLDDTFAKVQQAMALQLRHRHLIDSLDQFVAEAIDSGFVAEALSGR